MQVKSGLNRQEYNEVAESQQLHFLQSWEWGLLKQGEWEPLYCSVDLKKQDYPLLLLEKNLPGVSFAYLPKLDAPPGSEEELAEAVKSLLRSRKLGFVRVETENAKLIEVLQEKAAEADLLTRYRETIQPQWTNVIKLDFRDIEGFQEKIKPRYRRYHKKLLRQNIYHRIFGSGEKGLGELLQVMEKIRNRTDFITHQNKYFRKLWDLFSAVGKARIISIYKEEELLGSYLIIIDGIYAYELYGGLTAKGMKLRGGLELKWLAMEEAIKSGCKFYDQWGVAPRTEQGEYDQNHQLAAISQYKSGFGGEDVEFPPALLIVADNQQYLLMSLYEKMQNARIKLMKLYLTQMHKFQR